jgi:tetratricopeptide (TPR) repeat protein
MKVSWAFLLVFVLTVAWSQSAFSQGTAQQAAEAMNATGRGHYDAEEFAEALERFKMAYARYPSARYLFNAAKACVRLQDPEGAIFFFGRYLSAAPHAEDREQVRGEMESLGRELLGTGRKELVVEVTPAGAALTPPDSQSREVTTAPASLFMLPGSYQIAVAAPDYESQWVTVDVAPDGPDRQTVVIALLKHTVAAPIPDPVVGPVARPFPWQWVMLGVGAAGVVAGGAGGYLWADGWVGLGRANDDQGPDYAENYRQASRRYVAGQWLTAAGAAMAAGGVLGYFLWPRDLQKPVPSFSFAPHQEGGFTFGFTTLF